MPLANIQQTVDDLRSRVQQRVGSLRGQASPLMDRPMIARARSRLQSVRGQGLGGIVPANFRILNMARGMERAVPPPDNGSGFRTPPQPAGQERIDPGSGFRQP